MATWSKTTTGGYVNLDVQPTLIVAGPFEDGTYHLQTDDGSILATAYIKPADGQAALDSYVGTQTKANL